jgi:broad specificity phosphatase PhoE
MIYVLSTPLNTVEKKGRVLGNYPAHWHREEQKQIRELCQPLKAKGVQFVYYSDLDADAGKIVADELHAGSRSEYGLRRFNCGKHHGSRADHVEGILDKLIEKWRDNAAIPIRRGDSWISLEKRLFKTLDRIMDKDETAVIVTDSHTATLLFYKEPKALVMNGSGAKPSKVYEVKAKGA